MDQSEDGASWGPPLSARPASNPPAMGDPADQSEERSGRSRSTSAAMDGTPPRALLHLPLPYAAVPGIAAQNDKNSTVSPF